MASKSSVETIRRGYHIYPQKIWDARSCHVKESPITIIDIRRQLDIAAPFPSPTDSSSTFFTPALAKTMEDDSTFVDREPVGSGSLGSLSKLWYIAIAQTLTTPQKSLKVSHTYCRKRVWLPLWAKFLSYNFRSLRQIRKNRENFVP